jgi:hypothetical protein
LAWYGRGGKEDGRGCLGASEVDEKLRNLKEKREGSKDTN